MIAEAAAAIASVQIRETATVAGNLCQANRCWFFRSGFVCYKRGGITCPCYAITGDHRYFHAVLGARRCQAVTPSDLAAVFTALDGVALIRSSADRRHVPLARLYSGPGETVLRDGEIIESVAIPETGRQRFSSFEKMVLTEGGFAVVSACVSVSCASDGTVTEARIVLGGVANTPYRARAVERAVIGAPLNMAERMSDAWTGEAHPLRCNGWKVEAASRVLARAFESVAERRQGVG